MTGAWSEGPVPLRALRSTPAHVIRAGDRCGGEDEVDAHTAVLMKIARPVVPVAVEAVGVGIHAPERILQTPFLESGHGLALGFGDVRGADEPLGIPYVAIFGRNVEVAHHDERVVACV